MLFFELGPYKISLVDVFSNFKPKAFLENGFYKIRIVTLANKNLEQGMILVHFQGHKQVISKVYCKQKLSELLQLDIDWSFLPNRLIQIKDVQLLVEYPCAVLCVGEQGQPLGLLLYSLELLSTST
jgi:hypothetical protein